MFLIRAYCFVGCFFASSSTSRPVFNQGPQDVVWPEKMNRTTIVLIIFLAALLNSSLVIFFLSKNRTPNISSGYSKSHGLYHSVKQTDFGFVGFDETVSDFQSGMESVLWRFLPTPITNLNSIGFQKQPACIQQAIAALCLSSIPHPDQVPSEFLLAAEYRAVVDMICRKVYDLLPPALCR